MRNVSCLIAAGLVGLGTPAISQAAEDCFSAAVDYRVQYDGVSYGIVGTGTRHGAAVTPITASAQIHPSSGHLLIAIDQFFDWGSVPWIHPRGTTIIDFTAKSYDSTYHGGDSAPINAKGTFSVIPCSSIGSTAGGWFGRSDIADPIAF